MGLWYCEPCASLRGPCQLNICPLCGKDMLFATVGRQAIPAVATPMEQGKAPQFAQRLSSQIDVGSDIPGGGAT
jgi:hypothetical protein